MISTKQKGEKAMSKKGNKKDEKQVLKLAIVTQLIALLTSLIELISKIVE